MRSFFLTNLFKLNQGGGGGGGGLSGGHGGYGGQTKTRGGYGGGSYIDVSIVTDKASVVRRVSDEGGAGHVIVQLK